MIAVINRSTVSTDAEIQAATRACGIQVNRDCAPAWSVPPVPVQFVSRAGTIPAGAWPVYVLDDADQQGVLGWHSYDGTGSPYGRVFARTCKRYGASVSSVLSHEVLEALIDPHVDQWRGGYAVEVGDPVESDSYVISLVGAAVPREDDEFFRRKPAPATKIEVSNFALPAWWQAGSKGPWDFLHKTTGPFKLTRGGYAVTTNGTVWGEAVPTWKKLVKITDGSRTLRVVAGGAPRSQELRNELTALDRAA